MKNIPMYLIYLPNKVKVTENSDEVVVNIIILIIIFQPVGGRR